MLPAPAAVHASTFWPSAKNPRSRRKASIDSGSPGVSHGNSGRSRKNRSRQELVLVEGTGFGQVKGRDACPKARPVIAPHLVVAFHRTEGGRQRATRRVLERIAGMDCRLFADDTVSPNFFDSPSAITNHPMAAQQLHGLGAFVRNANGVQEKPPTVCRV